MRQSIEVMVILLLASVVTNSVFAAWPKAAFESKDVGSEFSPSPPSPPPPPPPPPPPKSLKGSQGHSINIIKGASSHINKRENGNATLQHKPLVTKGRMDMTTVKPPIKRKSILSSNDSDGVLPPGTVCNKIAAGGWQCITSNGTYHCKSPRSECTKQTKGQMGDRVQKGTEQ